jgi:ketosteroid isomerase-like protein
MDAPATARSYYERIDAGEYERLRDLLAPAFVHERPDRVLEGADRFVRFVREERPDPDTTHAVETVYAAVEGEGSAGRVERDDGAGDATPVRVAVEGRLLAADGEPYFRFLDAFRLVDGRIARLVTYTD